MNARTATQVVLTSLTLIALSAYSMAADVSDGSSVSSSDPNQSHGYADGCGCGNINCSEDGKVTLSDLTRLIDYFAISGGALPDEDAADVDLCDDLDLADLVLYIEAAKSAGYPILYPSFCSGTVDCLYSPEGDTVEYVVVDYPIAEIDDSTMQIDLYVRHGRYLAAAELALNASTSAYLLDSVVVADYVDTNLNVLDGHWNHHATALSLYPIVDWNYSDGLAPVDEKQLWASYYFTLPGWTETDSIVFDSVPGHFKLVRSPYDGSSADSLGYRPAWNGPLVVYADPIRCCGQLTGGTVGNTNCSVDGLVSLADISRLIDRVYISKAPLCCPSNGNMNGDPDGKLTLSDITYLIDAVYIIKCAYPICSDPPTPYSCD
jgi:hypothetical protein